MGEHPTGASLFISLSLSISLSLALKRMLRNPSILALIKLHPPVTFGPSCVSALIHNRRQDADRLEKLNKTDKIIETGTTRCPFFSGDTNATTLTAKRPHGKKGTKLSTF